MRRLSDRFAEAADCCEAVPQLYAMLADATRSMGFHHFALIDHSSLINGSTGLVRIHNYPESWVSEFLVSGYAMDDPIHLASRRTNTGFEWSELNKFIEVKRRHRQILSRSRDHGLGGGFTIPANVPGEPSASCSFVVRAGTNLPIARLDCAELIGAHALRAASRLRQFRPVPLRPKLSRREIECLRLAALGKTDWEISTILGISFDTARQYVKRARAAYNVVSRIQLVVHGLRDGWISFDEVIPPD